MSASEFPLDPSIAYLDHGSFGVTPTLIHRRQLEVSLQVDSNPSRNHYQLNQVPSLIHSARTAVAELIGAATPNDVHFINNTSTGVFEIIRRLPVNTVVLITELCYHSIRDALRARQPHIQVIEVSFSWPVYSEVDILQAVETVLDRFDEQHHHQHQRVSLAIFDHISSKPSIQMPIAALCSLCRARGIGTIIDGAHAPGQVSIDVEQLECDVYIGNLHKWCFVPRTAAFMWFNTTNIVCDSIRQLAQLVVMGCSNSTTISPADIDFVVRGISAESTRSYTSFIVIPDALAYWKQRNGVARNTQLLQAAIEHLLGAWQTDAYLLAPTTWNVCMATVPLPLPLTDMASCHSLQQTLFHVYHIHCPVFTFHQRVYVRLCAQIYNTHHEFVQLAHAINSIRLPPINHLPFSHQPNDPQSQFS